MKKNIQTLSIILILSLLVVGCAKTPNNNVQENPNQTPGNSTEADTQLNTETEAETEEVSDDVETVMYAQANVNVRATPSTEGNKLGMLSVNDKVIALGDPVNGWQKIRYEGKAAYVSAQYLGVEKKQQETSSETEYEAKPPGQ